MEAVGLVASVITLINAATLTGASLTRLMGLRGCPLYVVSALNEVNDFQATLTLVKSVLDVQEIPEDVLAIIARFIDHGTKQLHSFDRHMKAKVLQDEHGVYDFERPKLRRRAKVKEVLGEAQKEIDDLQKGLHSIKEHLMLAMNVAQLRIMPKLFLGIQQISITNVGHAQPPADLMTATQNVARDIEHAASLNDLQYPNRPSPATAYGDAPAISTYVKIETKSLSQTCTRQCPCQCHIPLKVVTPRWLQSLVGAAFINFTGAPILSRRSCDYKACANDTSGTGSVRFTYLFPAWLLRTSIKFTASWDSLSGVAGSWSLRVPRVINNAYVHMRLLETVRFASVIEISREMERLGVRAFDYFALGHSATYFRTVLEMVIAVHNHGACHMLLENGADATHPTGFRMTVAELFWQQKFMYKDTGDQAIHPDLEDMRDELDMTSTRDVILHGSTANLARRLQLDPRYCVTRDCWGATALHWAAVFSNRDAISVLVAAGAELDAVCKEGRPVLHWAVRSGSVECCKIILSASADLRVDASSESVHMSCSPTAIIQSDSTEQSHWLTFDLEAKDKDGDTAFMYAARLGRLDICDLLLDHGADIDACDVYGQTAFFRAVLDNNHVSLQFLIDRGASCNILDEDGDSILYWAAAKADLDTMNILREACIEGLPMHPDAVTRYWEWFGYREEFFYLQRASIEEEKAAFQALLDSIVPCPDPPPPPSSSEESLEVVIPGAYALEESVLIESPQ